MSIVAQRFVLPPAGRRSAWRRVLTQGQLQTLGQVAIALQVSSTLPADSDHSTSATHSFASPQVPFLCWAAHVSSLTEIAGWSVSAMAQVSSYNGFLGLPQLRFVHGVENRPCFDVPLLKSAPGALSHKTAVFLFGIFQPTSGLGFYHFTFRAS